MKILASERDTFRLAYTCVLSKLCWKGHGLARLFAEKNSISILFKKGQI